MKKFTAVCVMQNKGDTVFIGSDNKIKWKKLIVASFVTLALVLCGIFWFDAPWLTLVAYIFEHGNFVYYILLPFLLIGGLGTFFMWICVAAIWVLIDFLYKMFKKKVKTIDGKSFVLFYSVLIATVVGLILEFIIGRGKAQMYVFYDMASKLPGGEGLPHSVYDFVTLFKPLSLQDMFHSMPAENILVCVTGFTVIAFLYPRIRRWVLGFLVLVIVSFALVPSWWLSDIVLGAFIGVLIADLVKYKSAKSIKKK